MDTVLVYAKLHPRKMIEESRKAMHGVCSALHGEESFKKPTRPEWDALAASCSTRDMGTHLCGLPTGEHCPNPGRRRWPFKLMSVASAHHPE
jgi:hypothetical protein